MTLPVDNNTSIVFASPGMKKLFNKNVETNTGYDGNLNLLDTQSAFDQIFAFQPKIYHAFENNKDARNAKREITRFIDTCCLGIFIAV